MADHYIKRGKGSFMVRIVRRAFGAIQQASRLTNLPAAKEVVGHIARQQVDEMMLQAAGPKGKAALEATGRAVGLALTPVHFVTKPFTSELTEVLTTMAKSTKSVGKIAAYTGAALGAAEAFRGIATDANADTLVENRPGLSKLCQDLQHEVSNVTERIPAAYKRKREQYQEETLAASGKYDKAPLVHLAREVAQITGNKEQASAAAAFVDTLLTEIPYGVGAVLHNVAKVSVKDMLQTCIALVQEWNKKAPETIPEQRLAVEALKQAEHSTSPASAKPLTHDTSKDRGMM